MGENEKTGASIRAFKEIFPDSNVIAADIDIELQDKLKEESIELNFVDQMNETTVRDLFKSIDYELDLIIDDGLHLESSNLLVLGPVPNQPFFKESITSLISSFPISG